MINKLRVKGDIFKLVFITLLSASLFLLLGCSDSNDSSKTQKELKNPKTSIMIDSVISGLDYICSSGKTGTTNTKGELTCENNDTVTLPIGTTSSAQLTKYITPFSLFPNNKEAALNFAQLVQTLDTDKNVSNGIEINKQRLKTLGKIDFKSLSFDTDIQTLLGDVPLVNETDALKHLETTLIELDIKNDASPTRESPPLITSASTVSVKENQRSAFTIVATDKNNDTLTYSLSGIDSDKFSIDKTTGVVNFKTAPDYESKASYSLTVAVSDGSLSTSQTVALNVLDLIETIPLNTAPSIQSSLSLNIQENQTTAFSIKAIDRNNDSLSYSLRGEDVDYFNIDKSSGEVTFKAAPDYESGKRLYNIIAEVSDGNLSTSQTVSITILDLDEHISPPIIPITQTPTITPPISSVISVVSGNNAPVITSVSPHSVAENQTIVFTATATDTLIYSLSGVDANFFNIDSSSGVVTFKTAPDYESGKTSYSITLSVSDGNLSTSQALIISIMDVGEIVPILTSTKIKVKEDVNASFVIGNVAIIDVGDTNITSISLKGRGALNFSVANDGTITLASNASLDYESARDYNLTAVATNMAGDSLEVSLNINITDVADTTQLYIKSAVYDNNRTKLIQDDKLYIYFNKSINKSTISTDGASNYVIKGTGIIGTASGSDYNDTVFYRHTISQDGISGAIAISTSGDTNISMAKNTITDIMNLYPVHYKEAVVEKFVYIKKTGQITSYDDNGSTNTKIKDDGHYQVGILPSYTRDDTKQIVIDNLTKLIWQDNSDAKKVKRQWLTNNHYDNCILNSLSSSCHNTNGTTAATYCSELSISTFTDWRLPTTKELVSIVKYGRNTPSIDKVFRNTSFEHYWSSNMVEKYHQAWSIYFRNGDVSTKNKNEMCYVRCVRN